MDSYTYTVIVQLETSHAVNGIDVVQSLMNGRQVEGVIEVWADEYYLTHYEADRYPPRYEVSKVKERGVSLFACDCRYIVPVEETEHNGEVVQSIPTHCPQGGGPSVASSPRGACIKSRRPGQHIRPG